MGFRLGLYDPIDATAPTQFVGRRFKNTRLDLVEMRAAVAEFNRLSTGFLCLGVFEVPPKRLRGIGRRNANVKAERRADVTVPHENL
jgi:hypothetical protein